jgi:dCTP deaminase
MTLGKTEILKRLSPNLRDNPDPIIVTPILDYEDQIGKCGIDIRLGKQFIIFREHFQESLPPIREKLSESEIRKYQEEIIIPFQSKLVLHPGKLIMGSTLEYLSIPQDIECQVEGRSSWARLGLIIATATTVEPNFKGVITLELSNTGTIPVKLFPGVKIAQLIFHSVSGSVELKEEEKIEKKYSFSIGPSFSKIYKDRYLNHFMGQS